MSPRKASDLTVTDQFCGAGGSSIGATRKGIRVRMALNHWALAIETHNTNFPDTDHDCTDISACDPRRYPSTDVLITSPECTTHSPAGGSRHRIKPQRDLFIPSTGNDAASQRSRATMWDVPRFAEFHKYNIIIAENVVEVLRWPLFNDWLRVMDTLGYAHKIVCLNSMFCHPTPQSRDRVYIVFWRKGNRAPDLDFRPAARCYCCEKEVRARQTWKNGRTAGKYRTQYVYTCPKCRHEVQPYYFAALNALDLSLPAQRIGDRVRPLRPRTLERIKFGLEKYGNRALLVTTNQTNRLGGRVRTVMDPGFTQPACNVTGFLRPAFLVECANTTADRSRGKAALVNLPFLTTAGSQDALISKAPFIASAYRTHNVSPADHPVPTVSTVDRHALVSPGEEINVEDCYFRMLQPDEIGAAMAFPGDYIVLGNKRDKVKQFGNAVTPPAMEWLIGQAAASLHPERAA